MLEVLELFGGIGACTKALERLNIPYHIADYVEIDKYAVASFNAMHGTDFKPQDICTWDKDIKVDLILHGSPCQDFSISGKQAGGDKGSGTRSSLMYETIRIVEKLKPKYVVWENVKNLTSKKHRHNFDAYLETMEQLGYINYYQVLNAKDYGIPQNRERVFTISIRDDSGIRKGAFLGTFYLEDYEANNFEFPPKQELKLKLKDILEDEVDAKYYLSEEITKTFKFKNNTENTNVIGTLDINKWNDSIKRIYNIEKIAPTISTMQGGYREPKIFLNNAIRKLTPKECWRLMGFDDEDFEKAAQVNSNTQLYKQAGNSIVVNVLEAIFKNLLREYIKPEIIYIED
jgi:DNA (cytosine-5)-methyltransferase 1